MFSISLASQKEINQNSSSFQANPLPYLTMEEYNLCGTGAGMGAQQEHLFSKF